MRWAKTVTAVAVLGALALGGCGGESGGTVGTTTTTFTPYVPRESIALEEWQAASAAVCEEYEPQVGAVLATHAGASSPEEVAAVVHELDPLLATYEADLEAIAVPAARKRDVERTHVLRALNHQATDRLWAAARSGDGGGYQAALSALTRQGNELSTLYTDLGVPACA